MKIFNKKKKTKEKEVKVKPVVKKIKGLSERLLVADWKLNKDRKYLFTKEGKIAQFLEESVAKQTQKRFGGKIVKESGLFIIKK